MKNSIARWVDNGCIEAEADENPFGTGAVEWIRIVPLIGLHLGCIAVIFVGFSTTAVVVAIASYLIRMFAITGFYHRYFSHRSFRTSRTMQFIFALIGATATQRGPIWWAAHHRHHHVTSDTPDDCHSPRRGFWWSHLGWFLTREHFGTRTGRVPDLTRFPELMWLDRFDTVVPLIYALFLYAAGTWLAAAHPHLGTTGMQLVVWGYLISTVCLLHFTLFINSLAHKFGYTRFETGDDSKNNLWLALLTLGEGWHNNHHHYPVSARQGFYWWEIDITYYILKAMSGLGLIWGMKTVPPARLNQASSRAAGGA